jgi:hypothetical protein
MLHGCFYFEPRSRYAQRAHRTDDLCIARP